MFATVNTKKLHGLTSRKCNTRQRSLGGLPVNGALNSDQVISLRAHDGECERAPGPGLKLQASGHKHQASSTKRQAPSSESIKRQASSPKQQASSLNPQASSSMIREPRKSFTVLGPRASAMIKVLCGCFTWKAIWCGENRILFPLQTFNSTVKKWPLVL